MSTKGAFCVYTVLLGGYEALNPQPVAERSAIPFICLTDDPTLASPHWRIVQVEPLFPMDPIRSQRMLKLRPHAVPALQGFERSLYVDNSVLLKATPEDIVARYEMSSGLGLPLHSGRAYVLDEFIEVARLGYDDPGRIFEQLNHYQSAGELALAERPYWTAMLLREHGNAQVRDAMECWAAHVLRYSRRDQLSVNLALREAGLQPQGWDVDNQESWLHTWPHTPGRVRHGGMRDTVASVMPAPARLRELQILLDQADVHTKNLEQHAANLQAGWAQAAAHADELARALDLARGDGAHWKGVAAERQLGTDALQAQLTEAHDATRTARLATASAVLAAQAFQRAGQEALDAMRRSRSWRATAPLRWVRERLR